MSTCDVMSSRDARPSCGVMSSGDEMSSCYDMPSSDGLSSGATRCHVMSRRPVLTCRPAMTSHHVVARQPLRIRPHVTMSS